MLGVKLKERANRYREAVHQTGRGGRNRREVRRKDALSRDEAKRTQSAQQDDTESQCPFSLEIKERETHLESGGQGQGLLCAIESGEELRRPLTTSD